MISINEYKAKRAMKEKIIAGIRDGYIYGYLFKSSYANRRVVIDIGKKEYPTDEAEIWDGEKFVWTEQLNNLEYSSICGKIARLELKLIDDERWVTPDF